MSLTLPYPSIVFIPLDQLEAQDLNKVVANYEYISNQFPVSASNINANSFYYNYGENKDVAINNTPTSFHSERITAAGNYLVTSRFSGFAGASGISVEVRFSVNGSVRYTQAIDSVSNYAGNQRLEEFVHKRLALAANDTLALAIGRNSGASNQKTDANWEIIQIS